LDDQSEEFDISERLRVVGLREGQDEVGDLTGEAFDGRGVLREQIGE
jgi:hypothetical protein